VQSRLNIQEIAMPAAAAPAAGAAAAPAEDAPKEEKPKEKTMFNVKLEGFDAAAKPKVIKEVKALVPNLTLIEVRPGPMDGCMRARMLTCCGTFTLGQEIRGVITSNTQRKYSQGGCREVEGGV
jgi:hypothetical protein